MSVITRDFINKNIKWRDSCSFPGNEKEYDFAVLSTRIDYYKNVLQKHGVDGTRSRSIIIGIQPSIDQTACIFASFELGVTVCIIDYGRMDNFSQYKYIDPKTDLLIPIDYFIVSTRTDTGKFEFFNTVCNRTIVVSDCTDVATTANSTVYANAKTSIMKCTSSGTTGTPKVITHTHKFIYHLSKRNSSFYDKTVGVNYNLNHGSSFATFFIPAIHSNAVEQVINFNQSYDDNTKDYKKINHILMPYTAHVEEHIDLFDRATVIYTLGPIPSRFKDTEPKKIKDVISFFGSNETSGPTMISQLSNDNFTSSTYFPIDNFYKIEFIDKSLNVTLPYYKNKTIDTRDQFVPTTGGYKFLGRGDLIKINGHEVAIKEYEKRLNLQQLVDFDLIIDVFESQIYLAVWEPSHQLHTIIEKVNSQIKDLSDNNHCINKYSILYKPEFLSGVKIDNELLRHYFRTYVDKTA